MMKNQDKPIYPCVMQQVGTDSYRLSKPNDPKEHQIPTEGLTKREYFAIKIFAALVANGTDAPSEKWAISRADELLDELEKSKP